MRHRRADNGCDRVRQRLRGSAHNGFGIDAGYDLPGGDGCAVALFDGGQHARSRRGHFEHDLVGFDVNQNLVGSNCLASFFLPLQQGGFGHGFGQLRDFDFYDSHLVFLAFNEKFDTDTLVYGSRQADSSAVGAAAHQRASAMPLMGAKASSTRFFCCSWCRRI